MGGQPGWELLPCRWGHTSPQRWATSQQSLAQLCQAPERIWGVQCQVAGSEWERHVWTPSHPEGLLGGDVGCRVPSTPPDRGLPGDPGHPQPLARAGGRGGGRAGLLDWGRRHGASSPCADPGSPPSTPCPRGFPGTQCHKPSASHVPEASVAAMLASTRPPLVPGGGDTPGVPRWGCRAVQVAASRAWGRGGLAAGRVRLLAAPLHSSKESGAASRGRRRQEVSEAACGAQSRGVLASSGVRGCQPLPQGTQGKGNKRGCSPAPCGV